MSRYVTEMLPALGRVETRLELVVLAAPDVSLPADADRLRRQAIRPRPASIWEQLGMPRAARRGRLALLHSTTDRLPLVTRTPLSLYLFEDPRHRLTLMRGAQDMRHRVAGALTTGLFPLSLRRSAVILVSSEATARDVASRGIPPDRVRVVYPGVSDRFRAARSAAEVAEIRAGLGCADGYVLHFSSDDPRDNSGVALAAYAEASRRDPATPPLLIAGPVARDLDAQRERVCTLGVEDRVQWLGFRSGEALAGLYRGASVYLDPSLFEGFGFQVAEALASGAPVVCSNTTSLPEVVGDAGLLVPPGDVRGFAEALAGALGAGGGDLRRRGPQQAARFRWEQTAAETVAVWEELLG